jgi:hypothetical protein
MIGAGFGESVKVTLGLDHHQMHVERFFGRLAQRRDDDGADRQVWDETAIHHIDMDPVSARRIGGANFVAKPSEIGR